MGQRIPRIPGSKEPRSRPKRSNRHTHERQRPRASKKKNEGKRGIKMKRTPFKFPSDFLCFSVRFSLTMLPDKRWLPKKIDFVIENYQRTMNS